MGFIMADRVHLSVVEKLFEEVQNMQLFIGEVKPTVAEVLPRVLVRGTGTRRAHADLRQRSECGCR